MVSLIERLQSILAGVVLALLVASLVLVPQNRALADEGGGGGIGAPRGCAGVICDSGCSAHGTWCYLWPIVLTGCSAAVPPGNDCTGCQCNDTLNTNTPPCFCKP